MVTSENYSPLKRPGEENNHQNKDFFLRYMKCFLRYMKRFKAQLWSHLIWRLIDKSHSEELVLELPKYWPINLFSSLGC